MPHVRRLLTGAWLAALAALSPALAQDAAKPLRKITYLNYNVVLELGDAPLWLIPHAMGYFADEGLQVDIQNSGGSSAAIQLLIAGKGQFATSTPDQVMLAVQNGAKIKSFFNHNRTFGSALVVSTASGVKSLDELKAYIKGSAIGVPSLSSGRVPYARAWIRELGLREDEDVKLVPVGVGPQAAAALKADRVRALVLYDALYAAIEAETDIRFKRFETDWQQPLFAGVITATDAMIESDPDLVIRYGRAVAKALVFATTNPEAVVKINWKLFPDQRPASGKEDAELKKTVTIVHSMVDNWSAGMKDPGARWGGQTDERWTRIQDANFEAGVIKAKRPISDYFTDRFSAQINQFDAEAIRAQARSFNDSMVKNAAPR